MCSQEYFSPRFQSLYLRYFLKSFHYCPLIPKILISPFRAFLPTLKPLHCFIPSLYLVGSLSLSNDCFSFVHVKLLIEVVEFRHPFEKEFATVSLSLTLAEFIERSG
jgi:hypothetical protein